ncbi:F0F1 ATP synthase subunit alpha [Candidatus Kaiserbacteria bacterium CG_4_8_14_3_um_filter_38_9]|uniref:ATP synthase subunit alpha n=1 Tax=Candidatus Kaiserbacteria bacterium CG_4_8_14_3_um_filter_38_9 TaxID=1974599 RepID=A0A2M7IML0_9BACT|nr:MAG: F0F1 ATP synthase subunit alpha [Candidatus Kaiserbacteria bacterium CG_4_8_14_3_um_filter_38_9]
MSTTIIERIKKEIKQLETPVSPQEIGTVTTVGDGVAEIDGLSGAEMMEMVVFSTHDGLALCDVLKQTTVLYGLVLNLEEESVKVVILGESGLVHEGMIVYRTGKLLSVPVGESIVGRVINALGEPIDGKGKIDAKRDMPIERVAYGVMERSAVNEPIHTGIKAIDSMIPIGRGQRELIIGDRGTGKTTIAIDTIINQKYEPKEKRPICIYVAIGQKRSKTANIMAQLEEAGAMEYTTIIATSSSEASPLLFLAPFTGMAIGEYFMEQGRDVLIILDDLSKHAVAYRQMSLLLRRPPGREAYPGDIFYLHSRLLERSAKLSKELGGGSITALPIIETQEGDVSAYIPTNVISITDGQIFLEGELFNKGIRPALNVGISVSRVGSSAQTKAMKSVSGKIRLELAQFRELEAFMQFASDLDDDTKKRIDTGRKYVELLKQTQNNPMPFYKQVVSIYGANNGLLDGTVPENVHKVEVAYQEFILRDRKDVLDTIETERIISDVTKKKLDASITDFKEANGNLYVI